MQFTHKKPLLILTAGLAMLSNLSNKKEDLPTICGTFITELYNECSEISEKSLYDVLDEYIPTLSLQGIMSIEWMLDRNMLGSEIGDEKISKYKELLTKYTEKFFQTYPNQIGKDESIYYIQNVFDYYRNYLMMYILENESDFELCLDDADNETTSIDINADIVVIEWTSPTIKLNFERIA